MESTYLHFQIPPEVNPYIYASHNRSELGYTIENIQPMSDGTEHLIFRVPLEERHQCRKCIEDVLHLPFVEEDS